MATRSPFLVANALTPTLFKTFWRKPLLWAVAALALALLLVPLAASANTGAGTDLSNVFTDLSSSSNGQVASLFQWKTLLTFITTIVVPIVAIIAIVKVMMGLKDNPDPGHAVMSIASVILIAGVSIAVVVLPTKIMAASGALLW